MRLAIAAAPLLALLALPGLAAANPVTAGISFGKIKSKVDAASGTDANSTLSVFGRIGLTPRLGAQVEVQKLETDTGGSDIRTATALLVVELGSKGRLVPLLVAGYGVDKESTQYGYEQNAHHTEGGLGLEYRADGGFVIGADVRIGGRTIEGQNAAPIAQGDVKAYVASSLRDGEYRSARLTIGLRF